MTNKEKAILTCQEIKKRKERKAKDYIGYKVQAITRAQKRKNLY